MRESSSPFGSTISTTSTRSASFSSGSGVGDGAARLAAVLPADERASEVETGSVRGHARESAGPRRIRRSPGSGCPVGVRNQSRRSVGAMTRSAARASSATNSLAGPKVSWARQSSSFDVGEPPRNSSSTACGAQSLNCCNSCSCGSLGADAASRRRGSKPALAATPDRPRAPNRFATSPRDPEQLRRSAGRVCRHAGQERQIVHQLLRQRQRGSLSRPRLLLKRLEGGENARPRRRILRRRCRSRSPSTALRSRPRRCRARPCSGTSRPWRPLPVVRSDRGRSMRDRHVVDREFSPGAVPASAGVAAILVVGFVGRRRSIRRTRPSERDRLRQPAGQHSPPCLSGICGLAAVASRAKRSADRSPPARRGTRTPGRRISAIALVTRLPRQRAARRRTGRHKRAVRRSAYARLDGRLPKALSECAGNIRGPGRPTAATSVCGRTHKRAYRQNIAFETLKRGLAPPSRRPSRRAAIRRPSARVLGRSPFLVQRREREFRAFRRGGFSARACSPISPSR